VCNLSLPSIAPFLSIPNIISGTVFGGQVTNKTRIKEGRAEKPILYDEIKRLKLKPKAIVDAFIQVHSVIAKYVYSASANKLMFTESHIMTLVLLELMKLDIPALPLHDSVIVPVQHRDRTMQTMLDFYNTHTGFEIKVS